MLKKAKETMEAPLTQTFTNEQSRSLYRLAVSLEHFLLSKDFSSRNSLEKAELELNMRAICIKAWAGAEKVLKPKNKILQVSMEEE